MFEQLFTDGSTIERYRTAPLLDERLCWLEHCAESGARPNTLRKIAGCQFHLTHLLNLHTVIASTSPASRPQRSDGDGTAGARAWAPRGGTHVRFVGHALRWLRFANMLAEEPCRPRHAYADEVAIFANRMRSERGWSEKTVRGCRDAVDQLFDRLDDCGSTLDSVRIDDIDGQIAYWHARGFGRGAVRCYAQHLRTFFRFAEDRSWCMAGLADGILALRFHPGETIPKGLNREGVMRLLATTEATGPSTYVTGQFSCC